VVLAHVWVRQDSAVSPVTRHLLCDDHLVEWRHDDTIELHVARELPEPQPVVDRDHVIRVALSTLMQRNNSIKMSTAGMYLTHEEARRMSEENDIASEWLMELDQYIEGE
jgi:hypothetical protein